MSEAGPAIGIIMGSQSDWETMRHAAETLDRLGIRHEAKIASAHRTPDRVHRYASTAQQRGLKAIIAGAGGAAHLAGVVAATTQLPVLALYAAAIIALSDPTVAAALTAFRQTQSEAVPEEPPRG
jgi:5-(carboxyamino)imidazole ribonucleotide mutase